MIRLTLILLAGIGLTLSIAGREPAAPEDGAAVGAASAQTETGPADPVRPRLALDDEEGAIARALSAGEPGPDAPRPATLWSAAGGTGAAEPRDAAAAPPPAPQEAAPPPSADLFRVTAGRVNLRAGPSTADPVLDQVVRDQRVEVLESTPSGWSRVHVPETGLTAWIFDRFLTPEG